MASEKILNIIEEVKTLTVLELSELVHELEETFGVSAAAGVAVAAVPTEDAGASAAAALRRARRAYGVFRPYNRIQAEFRRGEYSFSARAILRCDAPPL